MISLEKIRASVADELAQLNQIIATTLHSDTELMNTIVTRYLLTKGKQLRPLLVLLSGRLFGGITDRVLYAGAAIEMLHNASLLHDDVIDDDAQRRGQPSVNARWGNTVAVLAGDYLLAQTMALLDEVDDREATRRINETVIAMTEAELLAQSVSDGQWSADTYLQVIDGKTARLFATACALGNPEYEEFGLHYGRLFQLHDDIADKEAHPFTADLIHQEEAILAAIKPTLQAQII